MEADFLLPGLLAELCAAAGPAADPAGRLFAGAGDLVPLLSLADAVLQPPCSASDGGRCSAAGLCFESLADASLAESGCDGNVAVVTQQKAAHKASRGRKVTMQHPALHQSCSMLGRAGMLHSAV